MIYLRIELEKEVFKTIELGESYVRLNVDNCDPNMNMGEKIHDIIGSNSYNSDCAFFDFIFKEGEIGWDTMVEFDALYRDTIGHYPTEKEHKMKVYIMNDKGATIESFTQTLYTRDELISK